VWIVVAGWLYALVRVRRRRRFAIAIVAVPLVYLVVAHWATSRWPGNEIAMQLANRGVGYAGLLAILPLSAGIAAAARFLGRRLSTPPAAGAAAATGALAGPAAIRRAPPGAAPRRP